MQEHARIVDILRDFAEVHRLVHELAARHARGELRFPKVTALIGDDEASVLFRLKERCHSLFRDPNNHERRPSHREALFDLAVGSLFHESMKLRENLYQREVYGPRVRALHSGAGQESKALFDEFEKMLGAVGQRLDEAVREVEALTQRTADLLRLLLAEAADDGCARFLTERAHEVEAIFGAPLNALLEESHGSVARGLERAGRSYLASGSFTAAADRFERALQEPGASPDLAWLRDCARGLRAYVNREYATSVRHLVDWAREEPRDERLTPLVRDVLHGIAQLAGADTDTAERARSLLAEVAPTPPG